MDASTVHALALVLIAAVYIGFVVDWAVVTILTGEIFLGVSFR